MPSASAVVSALQVIATVLAGAAAVRLRWLALDRRYRVLFAFLLFRAGRSALLLAFGRRSYAYEFTWIVTEPLLWIVYTLLVLELYSLVLEKHRGIYAAGRRAMSVALGLAVAISGAGLFLTWSSQAGRSLTLLYYTHIERGVVFSLFVFLVLMLGFLAWFPVPLSRNICVHAALYAVYFLSTSAGLLVETLTGQRMTQAWNLAALVLGCMTLTGWLLLLNPQGEFQAPAPRFHQRGTPQAVMVAPPWAATILGQGPRKVKMKGQDESPTQRRAAGSGKIAPSRSAPGPHSGGGAQWPP